MKRNAASTDFEPLVRTGNNTGLIMVKDLMESRGRANEIRSHESTTNEEYVVAALITGKPKSNEEEDQAGKTAAKADAGNAAGKTSDQKSDDKKTDTKSDAKSAVADKPAGEAGKPADADHATQNQPDSLNVVLVADADMLASLFFDSRARRSPDTELQIDADNVTFVLNALDVLAGDTRFVEVRNKRPLHRRLEKITDQTQQARDNTETALNEFKKASQEQEEKLEQEYNDTDKSLQAEIDKLQKEENGDPKILQEKAIDVA